VATVGQREPLRTASYLHRSTRYGGSRVGVGQGIPHKICPLLWLALGRGFRAWGHSGLHPSKGFPFLKKIHLKFDISGFPMVSNCLLFLNYLPFFVVTYLLFHFRFMERQEYSGVSSTLLPPVTILTLNASLLKLKWRHFKGYHKNE
jgi:hypothetical protein